jgi:hypothetical protein
MIFSLSLPRGIRRPYACVRPLGCGFLRPGKAGPETPEDGNSAEVAASWSPTSRCHPNRRRFARHDRRLRLGGEEGVAGPDVRPKPRATEGVTQVLAPAIPGRARETWPSRRPPHCDRVPAIPWISRDVASAGLCGQAAAHRRSWRSTRHKGVSCRRRNPHTEVHRATPPHRRAAHAERYGQAQSSQRVRHLSATPWTPVYAPDRAKGRRRSVTDPIAGNRCFIRPRACRGGAALTREGRAYALMVVAGALPCALTSADEARGDPCRLQHHERPQAPMAPDQHQGGWSGSRWFCRSTVSLSSRTSRETRTDRIVPALPADGQRLDLSWSRCGQGWALYDRITNCHL